MRVVSLVEPFYCSVVGRHPWKVIVLSCAAAIALSAGMMKLVITTDPVELWASPGSRSRIEKQYFDDNFQPFYRTEMLIIRPVDVQQVSCPYRFLPLLVVIYR